MSEITFNELASLVSDAFGNSNIKHFCESKGYVWNYSIEATEIIPNNPLIVGFNWGASMVLNADGVFEPYPPQTQRETKKFMDMKSDELGSFIRVQAYLKDYLPEDQLEDIGQANFCPFRSHKANQISEEDLKFCSQEFFPKLIEYAQPSMLLCFTSKLRELLVPQLEDQVAPDISIEGYNRKFRALTGNYKGIPTYFLPHPNYPMRKELREAVWDYYFIGNPGQT